MTNRKHSDTNPADSQTPDGALRKKDIADTDTTSTDTTKKEPPARFISPRQESGDARVSMLIELMDVPGALEAALGTFTRHGVNLTHIESRPARDGRFDFYVDCEGARRSVRVESAIRELNASAEKLLVLDEKEVPWFPRQIAELDRVANNTLEAGVELQSDHPGFNDASYRERRCRIERLARAYRHGDPIPIVHYTEAEHMTWRQVYEALKPLHRQHACREYLLALGGLERHCDYADRIPQSRDVSEYLYARTGFRLRPVASLLGSRDFLGGLAFRIFFATQYIRHPSVPAYTPEPDVCHELIGHAPMFADPAFADLSQEIGLASLGAGDQEITRLARCYWHAVEFGLVREGVSYKACGAGLLSSPGELAHACSAAGGQYLTWQPQVTADQDFPITDYQPVYFVADSLQQSKVGMRDYARNLPRPFHARYNPMTERIWVDRAVNRLKPADDPESVASPE